MLFRSGHTPDSDLAKNYKVIRREAINMRGPWTVKDTMILYPPFPYTDAADTMRMLPWHLGSRLISPNQIIFAIKTKPLESVYFKGNYGGIFLGKWTYPSDTIFIDTIPIIPATPEDSTYYTYKPDILFVEGKDGGLNMNIYAPYGIGNHVGTWMYRTSRNDSIQRAVVNFNGMPTKKDSTAGGFATHYNEWNTIFNCKDLFKFIMTVDGKIGRAHV